MGVYKLYKDKTTQFECIIELNGASINNADVRLVVESDEVALLFQGSIAKNGKCIVPIRKLGNIMKEETSGEMRLEVIVEDTYFQPWKTEFKVDVSKKLKVEVLEPSKKMKVRFVNDSVGKLVNNIIRELKSNGVTINNIGKKRSTVIRCINEHVANTDVDVKSLISKVVNELSH